MLQSLYGHRIFDPCQASQSHQAGFTKEVLQAWICNAHGREALLRAHPALKGKLYERHLGTDMVEMVFSALVSRVFDPTCDPASMGCPHTLLVQAGYKPVAELAISFLHSGYRLQNMQRDSTLGVTRPVQQLLQPGNVTLNACR